MRFHEFREPKPVQVVAKTLPAGVKAKNRKGTALGFMPAHDQHIHWLVVFDETGEIVFVPNPEVRMDDNWTLGRRGR